MSAAACYAWRLLCRIKVLDPDAIQLQVSIPWYDLINLANLHQTRQLQVRSENCFHFAMKTQKATEDSQARLPIWDRANRPGQAVGWWAAFQGSCACARAQACHTSHHQDRLRVGHVAGENVRHSIVLAHSDLPRRCSHQLQMSRTWRPAI